MMIPGRQVGLARFVTATVWGVCVATAGLAQDRRDLSTESGPVIAHDVAPFMQRKLVHAKNTLEGLVLRDFERIAQNAQQISLMSLDTSWQVLQSSEYAEKSAEFRISANELAEAAKAENLDGATLAYIKMTLNCVDCHKRIPSWQTSNAPQLP